jgi:aminoglycoside phosphotransferase (APT) family kinase protein
MERLITALEDIPLKKMSKPNHNASYKHRRPGRSGSPASPFPDLEILTAGLNSFFQGHKPGEQVTVLARNPNLRSGKRSPSEIVTIRLKDGNRRRLFCKYGGYDWHSHGLWGVAYEVEVYRQVLATLDATTAKFYGAYTAAAPNNIWLILEYLEDYEQLKDAPQPGAMIETVRWLGRFHAATEALLSQGAIPFLKIYDAAYYREWAKRTVEFAASQRRSFPWLAPLCRKWEELAEALLLPPTSIIHGDCYCSNILMRRDVPFVVDWESAASAVGEIDLAFLTESWPEEIVKLCEAEYQKTRWPWNSPREFSRRLQAGRLYQKFRWLGDHPEWTSSQGYKQLKKLAEGLGMI